MQNQTFSLTENAFFILKATYTSSHSDIPDLVDDAELDETHEQDLIHRAQQALLSPIARLDQELGWLPELSPAQIEEISPLLAAEKLDELGKAIAFLPDLPKANILAHICGATIVDTELLQNLLEAWREIDEQSLSDFVNAQRQAAGFPQVEKHHVESTTKSLGLAHARNAAMAVWNSHEPGKLMETLVEAELSRNSTSRILAQFVHEYDNLSEPHLSRISDAIDHQIEQASQVTSDLGLSISEISNLLKEWDDINQPVQVFEQHQGHEEGRSKRVYEKLRSLCLDLANERKEFSHAKRLSEALLHTFPELESVAEVLRDDLETLENLDKQKKQYEVVEPLANACEAAKSQLFKLKRTLQRDGFTPAASGILKEIYSAFEKAVAASKTGDAPFIAVRDLALFINNERDDPETAFRLINGLIVYGAAKCSRDLAMKLKEERSVLHRNWKMAVLGTQSGNLSAMVKTIDEMLIYATGKERAELLELKSAIQRKQTGKKVKWAIWAGIALFLGSAVFSDELTRSSSRSSYQPTSKYQPSSQSARSTTPSSSSAIESKPPVGQGRSLNKSQVRYCVFQGERLDAMRPMAITSYQISQFNGLITDYNSRCSNFRYTSGVLSSVQREAQSKTLEFLADARRIVASW